MLVPRMPRPLSMGSPALLALLVASAAEAETNANSMGGPLAIASDSYCPSAEAVREALLSLRPAKEWPSTAVAIYAQERSLWIDLGAPHTNQRQVAVGPDCAARAATVALIIATWIDDIPAEAMGSPILFAPIGPKPEPLRPKSEMVSYDIGLGLARSLAWGNCAWCSPGSPPHARRSRTRMASKPRSSSDARSSPVHKCQPLYARLGDTQRSRADIEIGGGGPLDERRKNGIAKTRPPSIVVRRRRRYGARLRLCRSLRL